MFRLTIRDLLWLTVAVALSLGWWRCWHSIPRTAGTTFRGFFLVAGKPVKEARVFLHSADGEFRGTNVVNGMFVLEHISAGKYRVTFDGKDVPPSRFGDLEVRPKDEMVSMTYDVRPPFTPPAATVAGAAEPFIR
jgi:hypothetical protein